VSDNLTETELKVLELMSIGLSNKEIAKISNVYYRTTLKCINSIYSKLQCEYPKDYYNKRVRAVLLYQEWMSEET